MPPTDTASAAAAIPKTSPPSPQYAAAAAIPKTSPQSPQSAAAAAAVAGPTKSFNTNFFTRLYRRSERCRTENLRYNNVAYACLSTDKTYRWYICPEKSNRGIITTNCQGTWGDDTTSSIETRQKYTLKWRILSRTIGIHWNWSRSIRGLYAWTNDQLRQALKRGVCVLRFTTLRLHSLNQWSLIFYALELLLLQAERAHRGRWALILLRAHRGVWALINENGESNRARKPRGEWSWCFSN